MKTFLITTGLFAVLALTSCRTKNIHKIAGDVLVEHGFEKSKWQDTDEVFYAVSIGEHGDEMEAYQIAQAEAALLIASKAEAITDAAIKFISSSEISTRFAKALEALRTVFNKAVVNNMKVVKDATYMNEEKNTYKVRMVVEVNLEDLIKQGVEGLKSVASK